MCLNTMIKRRVTGKRRWEINLEQPRINLIINHYIEAEELKAVASVWNVHLEGVVQDGLAWYYGFYDYVLDSAKETLIINIMFAQNLAQCLKAPFGAVCFTFGRVRGNKSILVLLVDRVVGQMDVFIVMLWVILLGWSSVFGRGETHQSFIIHVYPQRVYRRECHIYPKVEFQFVNCERVWDITTHDGWLLLVNVSYVICNEYAFSLR